MDDEHSYLVDVFDFRDVDGRLSPVFLVHAPGRLPC